MGRWFAALANLQGAEFKETAITPTDKTDKTSFIPVLSVLSVPDSGVLENSSPELSVSKCPAPFPDNGDHRCAVCGSKMAFFGKGSILHAPDKLRFYCLEHWKSDDPRN